jgi:hypothetical protein
MGGIIGRFANQAVGFIDESTVPARIIPDTTSSKHKFHVEVRLFHRSSLAKSQ